MPILQIQMLVIFLWIVPEIAVFTPPFADQLLEGRKLSGDSNEFFIFGCKVGVTAHNFLTFYESFVNNI